MKWYIIYKGKYILPHAYKTKEIAEVACCRLLAITLKWCPFPLNPLDYSVTEGDVVVDATPSRL